MFDNFSPDQIQAARVAAVKVNRDLIASLESGETKANDPESWIKSLKACADDVEAGKYDHNFTIWQRMNFHLTGESVPFLKAPADAN